jgi:hypothetical protein
MRRQITIVRSEPASRAITIVVGLLVVLGFVVFAKTGGSNSAPAAAPVTPVNSGGGGAGLPLGAPQSGAPGNGYAVVTGAVRATYRFKQITCIHSPNSPTGLLAKGSTDPNSPSPVTIGVATDGSTLDPIQLRIAADNSFSKAVSGLRVRRAGKTVIFSARLAADSGGAGVSVHGSMTCGAITTLG